MKAWRILDELLRGETTHPDRLVDGQLRLPIGPLLLVLIVMGAVNGICIGSYAFIRSFAGDEAYSGVGVNWLQPIASGIKIPAMFLLTLLVTLPSLYVFNALVGSRLTLESVVRLLLATTTVILAVAASLGAIVVFFAISTDSYSFMQLLIVLANAVGGFLGLMFLLRTMDRMVGVHRLERAKEIDAEEAARRQAEAQAAPDTTPEDEALEEMVAIEPLEPSDAPSLSALNRARQETDQRAKAVFRIWVVIFAGVGAQMSWVLRPFIGHPDLPFAWFRPRGGNFFEAVWGALMKLLGA